MCRLFLGRLIEKGLGGDWETLRRYLPSKASGGGLGTWQQGCKQLASQLVAKTGSRPSPAVGQGSVSDVQLI